MNKEFVSMYKRCDIYLVFEEKLVFVSDNFPGFDLDINRILSKDWHFEVRAEFQSMLKKHAVEQRH